MTEHKEGDFGDHYWPTMRFVANICFVFVYCICVIRQMYNDQMTPLQQTYNAIFLEDDILGCLFCTLECIVIFTLPSCRWYEVFLLFSFG